jgi:hypothetical protein
MSLCRDKNAVGILRIDHHGRDLLGISQTEVCPGLARIDGFVNSVSHG